MGSDVCTSIFKWYDTLQQKHFLCQQYDCSNVDDRWSSTGENMRRPTVVKRIRGHSHNFGPHIKHIARTHTRTHTVLLISISQSKSEIDFNLWCWCTNIHHQTTSRQLCVCVCVFNGMASTRCAERKQQEKGKQPTKTNKTHTVSTESYAKNGRLAKELNVLFNYSNLFRYEAAKIIRKGRNTVHWK